MPQSIALPGIAANFPNPGTFLWTNFAAGPSSGSTGPRKALLLANMVTGATATAATLYGPDTARPIQTEGDVIGAFKAGSEMHRGFLRFTSVNKQTPLYMMPITESSGSKATIVFTLLAVPNANGNLRIWLNDEFVDTGFLSGASLASITAQAVININGNTRWGTVATQTTVSSSNDSITLTAVQKGLRGNWLQGAALLTPGSLNTTVTNTAKASFTGGTTADDNTAALAAIVAQNFYYIIQAAEDSTQVGALFAQIESQALPTTGIRQRGFAGSIDTQSNINTIAVAQNAELGELIWGGADLDIPPFEAACLVAAMYAYTEASTPPRHNFSGFPSLAADGPLWKVPPPRSRKSLTSAQITSAIVNGVTAINCDQNGRSYLVKGVTTRSLSGGQPDSRIRDRHRVTENHFFADDLTAKINAQCGGKDIADDPVQGSPPPGPNVVMPRDVKNGTLTLVDDYVSRGSFKNGDAIAAATVVQHEVSPANRMSVRVPTQTIDIFDQCAVEIDQIA